MLASTHMTNTKIGGAMMMAMLMMEAASLSV